MTAEGLRLSEGCGLLLALESSDLNDLFIVFGHTGIICKHSQMMESFVAIPHTEILCKHICHTGILGKGIYVYMDDLKHLSEAPGICLTGFEELYV